MNRSSCSENDQAVYPNETMTIKGRRDCLPLRIQAGTHRYS